MNQDKAGQAEIVLHCETGGWSWRIPVANIASYSRQVGHTIVQVCGHGDITSSAVAESTKQIDALIAEAEELAAQELTVTLHCVFDNSEFHFTRITSISELCSHGTIPESSLVGGDHDGRTGIHQSVAESPAVVTSLARDEKAFGAEWNCLGAEPPVVAFPRCSDGSLVYYTEVTNIYRGCGECQEVHGKDLNGESVMHYPKGSAANVQSACAETGVPCPAEDESEKPKFQGDLCDVFAYCADATKRPYYWSGGTFHIADPQVSKLQERVAELEGRLGAVKQAYSESYRVLDEMRRERQKEWEKERNAVQQELNAATDEIAGLEERFHIVVRVHDIAGAALTAVCKRIETDWRAMRSRVVNEAFEELREKDVHEHPSADACNACPEPSQADSAMPICYSGHHASGGRSNVWEVQEGPWRWRWSYTTPDGEVQCARAKSWQAANKCVVDAAAEYEKRRVAQASASSESGGEVSDTGDSGAEEG